MVVREWGTKPRPRQSITEQHYQSTGGAQVSSICPTIDGSKIDEEDCCVSVCVCVLMQQSMSLFEIDYRRLNLILFVSCVFEFALCYKINEDTIKRDVCVCV